MNKFSTLVSASILVIAAVGVVYTSLSSSVSSTDTLASNKQRSILLNTLEQRGSALARELKVQTFWSEGYKNTRAANVEWMSEFYGSFLERVLGYKRIYILDREDKPIYAYEHSADSEAGAFERRRSEISDLIAAIRTKGSSGPKTARVVEAKFDIGKGQTVLHRAIFDVRLIDDRPSTVVVSTILPDSAPDEAIAEAPPLMVAVTDIDNAYLASIGKAIGLNELCWSDGSKQDIDSFVDLKASNGTQVGVLHWHSDRPGLALKREIASGLIASMALFVLLTMFFVIRSNRQSEAIETQAKQLAMANETLEQRVHERTEELEVTFANMAQGIVLWGANQKILISNQQSKALLEVDAEYEVAAIIRDIFSEQKNNSAQIERRLPLVPSRRKDYRCPSGRIVEVRHAEIAHGGSVVTISDVTALKRRQAELEAATDAANAASEAKSRFLSMMSHEMRTPLNGLIGALDLMQKSKLDPQQAELASIALQASEALLVHISDVLDFSKLEAGKFELDSKPFDIHRMANSVSGIVTAQVESQRNKLVVDIAEDMPRNLLGDSVRLRQVVLNFVSNANKFTRHGTIRLELSCIKSDDDSAHIRIAVTDSGIGIPQDRMKDLFQEFSMIETGYTRKSAGTGLGLAICKRLVESMNGVIGVNSEVGKGSTFWIEVPLPKTDDVQVESDAILEMAQKGFAGLKILLVDDNATNRLIGSKLLNSGGHFVSLAKNGREAVDCASETRYDAILMDISMPEMDGLEATRQIRRLAAPLGTVPIVALTANAIIGDREKFLAAGMNEYLTKPFRLADIQLKLAALLKLQDIEKPDGQEAGTPNIAADVQIFARDELAELADATSVDVVVATVETYLAELSVRIEELSDCLKGNRSDELKAILHAIAGASRSVGACQLADRSKSGELACIAGDMSEGAQIASGLAPLVAATEAALKDYLANLRSAAAESPRAAA